MSDIGYRDFCIGVRLIDNGQVGPVVYTPWASQSALTKSGWSKFVSDLDNYDPDGVQIGLIVGKDPHNRVPYDFRLGVGARDFNEAQPGEPKYSPLVSEVIAVHGKEGETGPAGDLDAYDPDAFAVGLFALKDHHLKGRLDFHLAVRVVDKVGPKQVTFEWGDYQRTPSNQAGGGWTPAFAYDKDQHDPDYMQLKFVIDGYWPM